MPQAPDFGSLVTWKANTDVEKWYSKSLKARSAELGNVDLWIDAYAKSKRPMDLDNLKLVLDTWFSSKMKSGTLSTIRDFSGAVTTLKGAVDYATRLVEPVQWSADYPRIYIAEDNYRGDAWVPDDFVSTVQAALREIVSQPLGKRLLAEISKKCADHATKRVIIEYTAKGSAAAPVDDVSNAARKRLQSDTGGGLLPQLMSNPEIVVASFTSPSGDSNRKDYVGGAGCSAVVLFNHKAQGQSGDEHRPVFIALAHELVHAHHYVHGSCYRGLGGKDYQITAMGNSGMMEEEMRTVGFGMYKDEELCENSIRAEHQGEWSGWKLRDSYIAGQSWQYVTSSVLVT